MNIEEEIKIVELKIKQKELNKKWFENPIYGTIILGFLTIVFNIIINSCNNKKQSDIEKDKFEYSVYLKALESGSQKEAIELIEFYEGIGIIKPNKFTLNKIEKETLPLSNSRNEKRFNQIYTDIFLLDDINGDKKEDTVVHIKPRIIDDNGDCLGNCITIFEFSNKKIPPLKYESTGYSTIESCQDINGDNINDVLVVKKAMNGTWYGCYIYSLINNKWNLIFNKGVVHDDDFQEIYSERIIKDKNILYFINDSFTDEGVKKIKIKI
jgi:hypothetical protein